MSHQIYIHYKGGLYERLHIANHRDHDKSNDHAHSVVTYKAIPGGRVYWATYEDFHGEAVLADGRRVPRFRFVGDVG